MAEGPTVARWADQLQALVGERLLEVRAPKRWQERAEGLVGSSIASVRSHGKNLLIEFAEGTLVRCHAMMYGSWQIGAAGVPLVKPDARVRLRLRTKKHEATFFSGPVVEFLTPEEVRSHHTLSALGPDIMAPDFDRDEGWRRMQLHPERSV
ncbi:MAG: DNA-formamidopyrimidine glycosylase family protein, partial [Bacteroidota bacterium]